MNINTCGHQQELSELYSSLAKAESKIADGDEGEDFFEVSKMLREQIKGKI